MCCMDTEDGRTTATDRRCFSRRATSANGTSCALGPGLQPKSGGLRSIPRCSHVAWLFWTSTTAPRAHSVVEPMLSLVSFATRCQVVAKIVQDVGARKFLIITGWGYLSLPQECHPPILFEKSEVQRENCSLSKELLYRC